MTLKQISGLGSKTINSWIRICGITPRTLTKNLTSTQWQKLLKLYEQHKVPNLKVRIQLAIEKKTYKGWRHSLNLPVRGQNTHQNAQTQRKLSPLRKSYHDWKNSLSIFSRV